MNQFLDQIAGTPEGARLAAVLALMAAFLHAVFGALQKGRHDPWVSRAGMDIAAGAMALPLALFVLPWPEPTLWPILAGVMVIHIGYKLSQAATYQRGAYTVVYPVVRGTAPLFVVAAATLFFGERYSLGQWAGVFVLVGGILGLGLFNLRRLNLGRETLGPALAYAVLTGGFVALYTSYDAWGIRQAANSFTFLAWFFVLDSWFMPLISWRKLARMDRTEVRALMVRGVTGALVAYASFGSIMVATKIGDLGRTAVLRDTSVVFSALVGWLILREKVGVVRCALMVMIAIGAMMVEVL